MLAKGKKTLAGAKKLAGKKIAFVGRFGHGNYGKMQQAKLEEYAWLEGTTVVDGAKIGPDILVAGAVGAKPPAVIAKIQKKHPGVIVLDAPSFCRLTLLTREEYVAILRSGPHDEDFWLKLSERISRSECRIDLTGQDLRKLDLSRAKLESAVVDGVDFREANLDLASIAKVEGAKFDGASMDSASIGEAEGCSFKNVTLTNARISSAVSCDFAETVLVKAMCWDFHAPGCSFKKADLRQTYFAEADFNDADFSGAILSGSTLEKSNLTGANLSGADLVRTNLREAKLIKADLRKANLTGAMLTNADLTGALIDGADFTGANLTGAKIKGLDRSTAKNFDPRPPRTAGPRLAELAKVANASRRLKTTLELKLEEDDSVVLEATWYSYGSSGSGSAGYRHRKGYGGYLPAPSFQQAMLNLVDLWSGGKPRLDTLTVEASKCPLKSKALKELVLAVWYDVLDLKMPSAEEMQTQQAATEAESASLREAMLAELQGGAAGVKKWNARPDKERERFGKFKGIDFAKARLAGVDLQRQNLMGSQFSGTNLKKAVLAAADLAESDFAQADLTGSNLSACKASDTSFAGAMLAKSILSATNFRRANFQDADLSEADMTNCDLCGTDFTNANLDSVKFFNTKFDEKTILPTGFVPPPDMVWKGAGLPGTAPVVVTNAGNMDFDAFYQLLKTKVEAGRIDNACKMLKAEKFQLFADVKGDSVVGVVRSQTSSERVYSCRLANDGRFACCTQNLLPCGGLRGALCKHILVLLVGLTKAGRLDPATVDAWIDASKSQVPALDKDLMSETFIRYKGAEAGEIDWRPTETIPEDFYAM